MLNYYQCNIATGNGDVDTNDIAAQILLGMASHPELCKENPMVKGKPLWRWAATPTFYCPPNMSVTDETVEQCDLAVLAEAREYFHNQSLFDCPDISQFWEFGDQVVQFMRLGKHSQEPENLQMCTDPKYLNPCAYGKFGGGINCK